MAPIQIRHLYSVLRLAILLTTPFQMAHAQTPSGPTPDQLIQILRSQPTMDVSAPVSATASFDPPIVRPGEKSIYRITFDATEISVRLPEQVPAPASLQLHPSVSGQYMQVVGGAMRILSTFNFDARATGSGTFIIPEFTAEVYGKPVMVPATRLEVKSELPEPHEPARQLLVEASTTNVFVGEALTVNVRLPATPARGVEGVSQIQINGEGFIADKNTVRQSIQTVEKNGVKVPTFIYEANITPITAGPLKLSAQGFTAGMQFAGPIVITGQVSISGEQPKFLLLESDPVTINVRPLPTDSELPGFTGALGNFTCDPPALATNVLNLGDPVELTVVVRGSPNLSRLTLPLPPHANGWQIFPAKYTGLVPGIGINRPGARFQYTLIPLDAEARATPAIPFSCFDPLREKYVNLTIPSVPVTIIAAGALTNGEAALMFSDTTADPEEKASLSRLAPAPGRTVRSLVPLQLHAWFPLIQLLPALVFCGLWFWDRRRRHLEQHPEIVRRRLARRALRREHRSLERTAAAGDIAGFIRCAVNAMQIASAPHYPAAPRALVGGDVLQIFTAAEREGKSGEIVRRFFAAADAAAFATNADASAGLLAEKFALMDILAKLEARL